MSAYIWLKFTKAGASMMIKSVCYESFMNIGHLFLQPRRFFRKTSRSIKSPSLWRRVASPLWGSLCLTVTVKTKGATIFSKIVWCDFFVAGQSESAEIPVSWGSKHHLSASWLCIDIWKEHSQCKRTMTSSSV